MTTRTTTTTDDITMTSTVVTAYAPAPALGPAAAAAVPQWEEIINMLSQLDVVRCLLAGYDRGRAVQVNPVIKFDPGLTALGCSAWS
jgi:hypothetical protein